MTKILNFGSLNLDYTYEVDHFVKPGETLSAKKRSLHCGGKGLNQSIALSRANAQVFHAGAIGKEDGGILLKMLEDNQIDTNYIKVLEEIPSGNAFIQVDDQGENCIVLYKGANHEITKKQVDSVLEHFEANDWLMLQNEINQMDYIIQQAKKKGMIICFNASPINEELLKLPLHLIDYFFINEEEGKALAQDDSDVQTSLLKKYPNAKFIMTLGKDGSIYFDQTTTISQPAYQTDVIDTTGAGDTFTGFVIAQLMSNHSIKESLEVGAKASSIAISRKGASSSIPTMAELEAKTYHTL